jgi:hypothetical protein
MADVVTAQDVAHLVAYVAPGFFARATYAARFGRAEASEFATLVTSVVLSLPIVALAGALADGLGIARDVTELGYVVLLLGTAIVGGYLVAAIRASNDGRRLLRALRLAYQPDSSIYAQTMLSLPAAAPVTVAFKDGRKLSGTPKLGPGLASDGVAELYLTYPAWWDAAAGAWATEGAGGAVIVPLSEVQSVTLDRDPTP